MSKNREGRPSTGQQGQKAGRLAHNAVHPLSVHRGISAQVPERQQARQEAGHAQLSHEDAEDCAL